MQSGVFMTCSYLPPWLLRWPKKKKNKKERTEIVSCFLYRRTWRLPREELVQGRIIAPGYFFPARLDLAVLGLADPNSIYMST